MRIAISALFGVTVTLAAATALAQTPADAPPPPPPPGAQPAPEPPAAVPSPFPPEGESADERMDVAGWRDGFFIRDSRDNFRFYPHALIQADFYSSFGPGVHPDTANGQAPLAPDTALGLQPRLSMRRLRLGFDAELLKRWSFTSILEFGGQAVGNPGGTAETSAAKPGVVPSASTGRYAAVQSIGTAPFPIDVAISYSVCKCFNIQLGQFNTPFSMQNRTGDDYLDWMERNVGIHSFVLQSPREIGGMLWGELGPRVFVYEVGVFGGDGMNRPSVDARVDFIGRMFVRPFAGGATSDFAKYAQIGVSLRHGDRDPAAVAYDYTPITTNQGYVLWKPTYTDSLGRQIHIIASGAQNVGGGEIRLRGGRFAFQGEAYYLVNNTREAVDGYQLTNTERLGRMKGLSWYGQLSAWPVGDAFLTPDPGVYRPRHLDLSARSPSHTAHGLEVLAMVSGINASYDGASRLKSTADSKTPSGDLTVYQIGVGANYWHTKHARFGVNYMAYVTPGSGTSANTASVPDNLSKTNMVTNTGHVLHELGVRLSSAF
jgi:hypothetical protein